MSKQNLLILPFDHRSSFSKKILGIEGKLDKTQKNKVKLLKDIVYAGFLKAQELNKDENLGILVDEVYGSHILKDAKKRDIIFAMPVEKSGKQVFEFQYGKNFKKHLITYKPDYAKVLVRYNPLNEEDNIKQLSQLKLLSKFCQQKKFKIMFELLVPPTKKDLKIVGSINIYDKSLRLNRTIAAINEIKKHVKVSVWKLEGFEKGWSRIAKATNKSSKLIVLGRGGSMAQVKRWLDRAKKSDRTIGFAIGRTIFQRSLEQFVAKKYTKQQAIDKIAREYNSFINYWLK